MPQSLYLRQKVINFVENNGMFTEAAHIFGIEIASISRQLYRPKLEATKAKYYLIKLELKELKKDIKPNKESLISRQR